MISSQNSVVLRCRVLQQSFFGLQVVGEMGFFFGMRHITHARAHSSMPTTLFALPKADYNQLVKLYPDQV